MKWFRLWTDILDDVKMLELTDYEYRIFTYLLAYASEIDSSSGQLQTTFTSLSQRFRQRFNHFSRAIETFQRIGLIGINGDGYITITNWNKRQFKSDNTYARVKKYREVTAKRNVSSAVSETVPDTDTDKKKVYKEKKKFIIPSIEEVSSYCLERGRGINPQTFIDYYEGNGWKVGRNPMKDWRAVIRTWESRGGGDGRRQDISERGSRVQPAEWEGDSPLSEADRLRNIERARELTDKIDKGGIY